MASVVTIQHRETTPGKEDPISYPLEILEEEITARELIKRSVREHLRKLEAEGFFKPAKQEITHFKLFLSQEDIDELAEEGKVAVGIPLEARDQRQTDPTDPRFIKKAEDKAISAFNKGTLSLLVRGRPVTDLQQILSFDDQTRVTFLRLVPLIGG